MIRNTIRNNDSPNQTKFGETNGLHQKIKMQLKHYKSYLFIPNRELFVENVLLTQRKMIILKLIIGKPIDVLRPKLNAFISGNLSTHLAVKHFWHRNVEHASTFLNVHSSNNGLDKINSRNTRSSSVRDENNNLRKYKEKRWRDLMQQENVKEVLGRTYIIDDERESSKVITEILEMRKPIGIDMEGHHFSRVQLVQIKIE